MITMIHLSKVSSCHEEKDEEVFIICIILTAIFYYSTTYNSAYLIIIINSNPLMISNSPYDILYLYFICITSKVTI